MKMNETIFGERIICTPPKGHTGYSPTKDGKILGRYKYYQSAEAIGEGTIVMEYKDAIERGLQHGHA